VEDLQKQSLIILEKQLDGEQRAELEVYQLKAKADYLSKIVE
jgi:hypothetical protein